MSRIPLPPGVFDIVPHSSQEPWRSSHLWHYVEHTMREMARHYGYQEIRTPIFERVELFERSAGETSDIVSKEMYVFEDKGERKMALRPEGTAPVMRAFVENQLANEGLFHKLYYIGPMFRYDRPQAGRYRQHHQFGVEVLGSSAPEQDAEVIDLAYSLYTRLGLKNLKIYLNSLGDSADRKAYRDALQEHLRPYFDTLSADSKARFEANPLRILDSKDPQDKAAVAAAPSLLAFLSPEAKAHFEKVKDCLDALKIPYEVNPGLVRGLDYYNRTVFEVVAGELGAQNSIGGGGRYDGLLKELDGPDLPSIGFGTGIERIIQTLIKQEATIPGKYKPLLYIIALGEDAQRYSFKLTHDLRQEGIDVFTDYSSRKLGKHMQHANHIGAQFVVVMGEDELKNKAVELKSMTTGLSTKIPLSSLPHILKIESQAATFLEIWPQMSEPFSEKGEAEYFYNKLVNSLEETKTLTQKLQNSVEVVKKLLTE